MARRDPVAKTKKKQARTRHTPELKKNAVDPVLDGDASVASVAKDLGVADKSLYDWVGATK